MPLATWKPPLHQQSISAAHGKQFLKLLELIHGNGREGVLIFALKVWDEEKRSKDNSKVQNLRNRDIKFSGY